MQRLNFDSGTPWEAAVGYSRAVRVGPHVFVTGTLAAGEDGEIVGDDAATQTRFILDKIRTSLETAGARIEHVVRTRIYLLTLDDSEAVGQVHREWFGDIRPCATMLAVSDLFTDEALVEIEVDAVIHE
ncbi:MAG: hypothetical protein CMJ24_04055 [Phycisphaerae bacterium]|mgnify:CR=1 FL=1|nr:hypothetical protein [Phycisphaerae bacterium]MDG1898505.1 RidA family protein [Phycisphaerales bacterium]|tara:strand:- start:1421 stop:1807 length:387 start_codon:yes stop_codon:yes gene_type:complete